MTVTGPDLIVIGDVMLDVTVSSGVLVRGADVHGDVRIDPGGSAANVAVWAAEAGASVRLYGCVGDDAAGRIVGASLRGHGVETMLTVVPSARTGAMLVVTEAGERSMVAHRGANSCLGSARWEPGVEAPGVFVSGYTLLDANTEHVARSVLARSRSRWLGVDAASRALVERRGRDWFFEATRPATVLFANEAEAEALVGARGREAAMALSERYALAIVKAGTAGAWLGTRGTVIHAPAPDVDEADPTGAGDAFDGAFLASLVTGGGLELALARACAAGARCVAQPGRWPATPRGGRADPW